MGTWNTKPFGNDTASDWLWTLEKAADESVFQAALNSDSVGEKTIAAATVIEAARRQPVGKLPPEAKSWISERGFVPSDGLVKQAIAVVEKVRDNSELRELWAEAKSLAKWLEQVELLLEGLREGLSKPAPSRKPKAPIAPRLLHKLIEKINPNEESPLREKLRQKLELLGDVNAPIDFIEETALNLVAAQGLIPEAQRLVERGAKIHPEMESLLMHSTPLEVACSKGQAKMAEWLLAQGAEIYIKRSFPSSDMKPEFVTLIQPSALYGAVRSGSIATIEVLVRYGARLVTDDIEKEIAHYRFHHDSLIHKAAESNHPLVIEFLAKNGVCLETKDYFSFTPLLLAVNLAHSINRTSVIEKLLSLGANPNTEDKDGNTSLDMVFNWLTFGHTYPEEVVKMIKEHGGIQKKSLKCKLATK